MRRGVRIRRAVSALACLGAGLFIFLYRGPGWRPLRHTMGDVVVTPFLFFGLLSLSFWPRGRVALGVLCFSFIVEGLQMLQLTSPADPWWVQLTFGSTADPLDLIAYAVGVGGAYAVDRWLLSGAVSASPP